MAPIPMANGKYDKKLTDCLELVRQYNMKALKKAMRSKLGKNGKLVQKGISSAFKNGNCEALRILLTSPLPNLCDDDKSLLHCVVLTSEVKVLKIFLADARFDVNQVAEDLDGRTPLMVACLNGKLEMVKELLCHSKIDVNVKDEKWELSALFYALHFGNFEMVQLIINHKDISHFEIQKSFLNALFSVSCQNHLIDLECLNMVLKMNFENEFQLQYLYNGTYEFHEHFHSWIAEELENKIREDYYNSTVEVSEEALGNKAFGINMEILQASILNCKCVQCTSIKDMKRQMYSLDFDDQLRIMKNVQKEIPTDEMRRNILKKKAGKVKCELDTKMSNKANIYEIKCEFLRTALPEIFQDILLYGGHDESLVRIINGTKTLNELSLDIKDKKDYIKECRCSIDENQKPIKEFNSLCWSCSVTQVKLYKCGGCHKARYCSNQCISNDWEEHMTYCLKVQQKRLLKKSKLC